MCEKPDIFALIFLATETQLNYTHLLKTSSIKQIAQIHFVHSGRKKSILTNIHQMLLVKYNVSFDFIPSSDNSGSFLTLWSSNFRAASNTNFQMLKFVKLDWFVINLYAKSNFFQATLNSLKLSIRFFTHSIKTIMAVDFIALSYGNYNSSCNICPNTTQ